MTKKDMEAAGAALPEAEPAALAAEPGTAAKSAAHPAPRSREAEQKPDGCAAGFYCYIGPTLQGLIRNGAIFRGTRGDALAAAAAVIKAQPLVKTLIVSGDALADAYRKVRQPGNALYETARRIAGKG